MAVTLCVGKVTRRFQSTVVVQRLDKVLRVGLGGGGGGGGGGGLGAPLPATLTTIPRTSLERGAVW
jgi:hypothetical protein